MKISTDICGSEDPVKIVDAYISRVACINPVADAVFHTCGTKDPHVVNPAVLINDVVVKLFFICHSHDSGNPIFLCIMDSCRLAGKGRFSRE